MAPVSSNPSAGKSGVGGERVVLELFLYRFHLSGNNRPGPMFTTIERARSAVLTCHMGCTEWARLLFSLVAAGAADLQLGRSHPYHLTKQPQPRVEAQTPFLYSRSFPSVLRVAVLLPLLLFSCTGSPGGGLPSSSAIDEVDLSLLWLYVQYIRSWYDAGSGGGGGSI